MSQSTYALSGTCGLWLHFVVVVVGQVALRPVEKVPASLG